MKVDYRAKLLMVKEFLNSQGIHARRLEKMGALAIDNKKYARVLARVVPRVIKTQASSGESVGDRENQRAVEVRNRSS